MCTFFIFNNVATAILPRLSIINSTITITTLSGFCNVNCANDSVKIRNNCTFEREMRYAGAMMMLSDKG